MTSIEERAHRTGVDEDELRKAFRAPSLTGSAPACPVWCELDSGHEPGPGARVHCRTVAKWGDRVVKADGAEVPMTIAQVSIAAVGRISDDETTETLDEPLIDLHVNEDLVEDLGADQARNLGRFLADALNEAALQLERIDALH